MKAILEDVYIESGLRNITKLAKQYNKAQLYFHMDLDGVTSGIAIKEYLKQYGITVISAEVIQYGDTEYSIKNPKPKTLQVLVDFAHGKPMMNIHTDHHDNQTGTDKSQSTAFSKTPSNVAYISQTISPTEIFPPKDIKFISMIDSAGFAKEGYTPADVIQAMFNVDKEKDILRNKANLGFVVNKLILAYKNKPEFLTKVVMGSNASLISMYNTVKSVAKELGLDSQETIQSKHDAYEVKAKSLARNGTIEDIDNIKLGEYFTIGNIIVQYGAQAMKGGYDRYTVFKNNPDAEYLCIGWAMGLVQISKNPFKKGSNPINLGELARNKILPKFKSKMEGISVSLGYIKQIFESKIQVKNKAGEIKKEIKDAVGFTMTDFIALFPPDKVKGVDIQNENKWKSILTDIAKKNIKDLSQKQKDLLKKVTISLWDVVLANSGGHKDITNISGLNFAGKGYVDTLLKPIMKEIAKEMQNAKLSDEE